jgi:hypothetical protein
MPFYLRVELLDIMARRLRVRFPGILSPALESLQNAGNLLEHLQRILVQFTKKINNFNALLGTLTPSILVRIQVPQPGSRVSGVIFPGV